MNPFFFKEVSTPLKSMGEKIPDFSKGSNDMFKGHERELFKPNDNSIRTIHTRNESLEGDKHPISGVEFVKKTVETDTGELVEGVFPVFDSDFDLTLPDEMLQASDKEQFKECNQQLKDWVEANPEEAKDKFSLDQLDDISNDRTPEGCTWHHSEDKGKMQLIDSEVHAQTGHTGGKSIWGGGNENR